MVPHRFVIGIEIPEMAPTVLINDFSPVEKGVVPFNGRIDHSLVVIMFIGTTRS